MSTYCEGSDCSKRDNCKLHNPGEGTHQYIDWSRYGSARYWRDKDGICHSEIENSCGDVGNFKHFEPILIKINKQELIDAVNDIFRTHYEGTMNTELIPPGIRQCERFVINELWQDIIKVLKQLEEV